MEELREDNVLELSKTQKVLLGGTVVLTAAIAFTLGYKYSSTLTNRGLARCFEVDPELEARLWKDIGEAAMKMNKK